MFDVSCLILFIASWLAKLDSGCPVHWQWAVTSSIASSFTLHLPLKTGLCTNNIETLLTFPKVFFTYSHHALYLTLRWTIKPFTHLTYCFAK